MYMVCYVCVGNGAGTTEERRGLESSSKNICKTLQRIGVDAKILLINDWNIKLPPCDFVFNLCDNNEGLPDSFINFTEYLEKQEIKYTGNTSACFKKHYDKCSWSDFFQIKRHLPQRGKSFSLTFCFKTIIMKHRYNHGSLYPINVYKGLLNFKANQQLKTKEFFYEQFIIGKEITVSCLPNGTFYVGEHKQTESEILDFQNKWRASTNITPPILSSKELGQIEQMVRDVKNALDVTSYMRLDLRIDSKGALYLIDINPNCSLDPRGSFCRVLKLYNITPEKAIYSISSNFLGTYL